MHFFFLDYIRGTAALCILALATDIFATFLAGKSMKLGCIYSACYLFNMLIFGLYRFGFAEC